MDISLIICTYNRCHSLTQALESVAASVLPAHIDWEVLVVDNNSKDQTRTTIEEISRRHPGRFRYLFESKQGLSNARNAGIAAAHGQVIAFTDDDVTVDPLWLQNLTAPLLNGLGAGAAGRILLGDFQPPRWLAITGPFSLGGSLVQFDLGEQPGPLNVAPFGASMAFMKKIFEKYGGFRADLGRTGKSLLGSEDIEFGERLMGAQEPLYYAPSAVVYHPVLQERLTKKYFRSYWFGYGRSLARQSGQRLSAWKVPKTYLKELKHKIRWIASGDRRWYLSRQGRFFCEVHVFRAAGQIVEGYSQLLRGRKPDNDSLSKTELIHKTVR